MTEADKKTEASTATDFTVLPDLASRLLGAGVVACSDEFFAPADSLIAAHSPTFAPATFSAKGQVYDGWETRRRRGGADCDWAIVRLGTAGVVRGVVVDTAFFTGNYPPFVSVEGCRMPGYPSPAEVAAGIWTVLVPRSPVVGNASNRFAVASDKTVTHVRLSIYPDGGVARLRVHGLARVDPASVVEGIDLAAMRHGGRVIDCSDQHFGLPNNLLLPGDARTMGEGWETARRRDNGNDWVVVRLGFAGLIRYLELDTSHFKGNAPGWAKVSIRGEIDKLSRSSDVPPPSELWREILPRTRLQPDTRHVFAVDASAVPSVARWLRLDIYPDGGLARLRAYGTPVSES